MSGPSAVLRSPATPRTGPIHQLREPAPKSYRRDRVLGLFVVAGNDVAGEKAIGPLVGRVDPTPGKLQIVDDPSEIYPVPISAQVELMLETDDRGARSVTGITSGGGSHPLGIEHVPALGEYELQCGDDWSVHSTMRARTFFTAGLAAHGARIGVIRTCFLGSIALFDHDFP